MIVLCHSAVLDHFIFRPFNHYSFIFHHFVHPAPARNHENPNKSIQQAIYLTSDFSRASIKLFAAMSKRQSTKAATEGARPPLPPRIPEPQQPTGTKSEKTRSSSLTKLVRNLTTRVKSSREKQASLSEANESAEETLAGFKSRNPGLYAPTNGEPETATLAMIPEPVVRAKSLSKSQRELERLENPLIVDPTPIEAVEEREKARETMRQNRSVRFQKFLEEYL